jgi:transposase
MREVLNTIFYVLRGGIAWHLILKDLIRRSTTYSYSQPLG